MPAADFRHARSGSLSVLPPNGHSSDVHGAMAANPRFDGPRSPPNTSHVPCKFFRQGACQAGNSCPFSHDIGAATETVCKYFAKGNCKFGPKCANIHVLPDGRRVNYGKNGVTIGNAPLSLGSRINPTAYIQPSNSALTNSFLHANAAGQSPYNGSNNHNNAQYSNGGSGGGGGGGDDRYHSHQLGHQPSIEAGLPTIDTTYSSNPTSAYGSPPGLNGMSGMGGLNGLNGLNGLSGLSGLNGLNGLSGLNGMNGLEDHTRGGLGLSPVNANVLSVMDAPLPASFDSNGISHAARYGPWPASVPSKFGIESPIPSLHNTKDDHTSETLKLLHTSAFGSSDHLSSSNFVPQDSSAIMGSSPTTLNGSDEYFGKRTMHSSSTRYTKPKLLSSSAPKVVDRDWDTEFLFLEEDYVPGALANEVLTPQEKARRGSLRLNNDSSGSGDGLSETPTASGTPSASATKFGSPATAAAQPPIGSSPNRWNPWLQHRRQRSDEDLDSSSLGRSMKHTPSAFGHVGSPLRTSSLAGQGGDLNGRSIGGDAGTRSLSTSLGGGSASVRMSGGDSLSVLTQQLQRTRLGDDGTATNSSPRLRPHAARNPTVSLSAATVTTAAAAGIIGRDRDRDRSDRERNLERHISSGSISSPAAGRFPTPIDEEDPAFLFSMEEEDEATQAAAAAAANANANAAAAAAAATAALKRKSGGLVTGNGTASSSLWSYAGIVSGKGAPQPRDPSTPVESIGGR